MRSRRMALGLAVPVVVAAFLAGCGGSGSSAASSSSSGKAETRPVGDIPDTQAYVAYSPPGAEAEFRPLLAEGTRLLPSRHVGAAIQTAFLESPKHKGAG